MREIAPNGKRRSVPEWPDVLSGSRTPFVLRQEVDIERPAARRKPPPKDERRQPHAFLLNRDPFGRASRECGDGDACCYDGDGEPQCRRGPTDVRLSTRGIQGRPPHMHHTLSMTGIGS